MLSIMLAFVLYAIKWWWYLWQMFDKFQKLAAWKNLAEQDLQSLEYVGGWFQILCD